MILHVDVISDVICPWCYIGKRRLEKAIAALFTVPEDVHETFHFIRHISVALQFFEEKPVIKFQTGSFNFSLSDLLVS
jgi:predicted DsbA family dithiol-disulfide isomerase